MTDLNELLTRLPLTERQWAILDMRFGFGRGHTLEEAAKPLKVTRERVRQLEKKAIDVLQENMRSGSPLASILRVIDEVDVEFEERFPDAERTVRCLKSILSDHGWSSLDDPSISRLCIVVRATASRTGTLSRLVTYICLVSPPLTRHQDVRSMATWLKRLDRAKKRNTPYHHLAVKVLERAGEPLHWREIAQKSEALNERDEFSYASIFNVLCSAGDFTRTAPGTYGLTSWNVEPAEELVYLVALVLHDAGAALPYGAILQTLQTLTSQPVKPVSVKLTLDLNPRFYESIEETYGLRAWLPPRHEQTLRTPRWCVETPRSFERVARAESVGYNVQDIVNRDL